MYKQGIASLAARVVTDKHTDTQNDYLYCTLVHVTMVNEALSCKTLSAFA